MNDPHVESLTFELETDDSVSFDASPVEHETDTFSLRLEDGTLNVDLKQHFGSVDEARDEIEEFLRAWEVKYGIDYRGRDIAFEYEDAKVIDRDPPAADATDEQTIEVSATGHVNVVGEADVSVVRGTYPDPPEDFRLSSNAQMLWNRYEGYEQGTEPLFSMAYACLATLEGWAGSRNQAENRYNIHEEVTDKIGELTTRRGSPDVARKPREAVGEAAAQERKWIEHAIREIVRQVGVHDAGHNPTELTMDDLPDLA